MEIICIGNELLIGKILNTNAQWIARRATSLGVIVKRITVVSDDVDEIASAVKEAVQRGSRFIITTGGLGPTFDDKTLEGIAKALNRELKLNEKALKMIKEKYESYFKAGKIEEAEMASYRAKMAMLPEGAEPLPNPVGTAPGVLINTMSSILIALPGFPHEMEAIFESSIVPLLKKESKGLTFYGASLNVNGIMESTLAPLLEITMRDNPHVYIKSYPRSEKGEPHIEVYLSTIAENSEIAKSRLGRAAIQLSELVKEKGGRARASGSSKTYSSP